MITAIASSCLVSRDTLVDIDPSFESDTHIVLMPPDQSASSNCVKVVECDVEVYRKKAQSICVNNGASLADVGSLDAQFWAAFKKQ